MRNHSMMINQLLLGGAVLDQTLVFGIALGDQAAVALGVVEDLGSRFQIAVAVVDDVATTGATLHEAAKALYKAGAEKVLCIAFAGNRAVKNAEPF